MTATISEAVTVLDRYNIVVSILPFEEPAVSVYDSRARELGLFSASETRFLGLGLAAEGFAEAREAGDATPKALRILHLSSALLHAAELLDPTAVGIERTAQNLADLAEADQ